MDAHSAAPLCAAALLVATGCTAISGVDAYVFDIDDAGATGGSTGSGGTGATGGAGANGGTGGGAGGSGGSCEDVTLPFNATAAVQFVPDAVSYLHVKAWGAGGNEECGAATGSGGVGGFTEAVFAVTPGEPLTVLVGVSTGSSVSPADQLSFGFPGGGAGGLSGVFTGADPLTAASYDRALIIAGGGGGAGNLSGNCNHGHPGNHPTNAGGQATMLGEDGSAGINSGGGGYRGGDGGSPDTAPGKGGTGHVAASALDSDMAHGSAGSLTPPRAGDPDYQSEVAMQERAGLVVMHFLCDDPPAL